MGRAVVFELAQAGCDVAIHYRDSAAEAGELVDIVTNLERRAVTVSGDLAKPSEWPKIIKGTVDSLGRLDILVNNAAGFLTDKPDTIEDFDPELWDSILRINLVAPAGLAHQARPYLENRGQGVIVNMCDISGERPWPNHLAYCCSKAALIALTKGLARALAPGVRVNGVSPGIAVFPEGYSEQLRSSLTNQVPLRRAGSPEEIARLVRFIAESADYMTGEIVHLDGGRSLL